jgi:phospholipase/carboxylesterase
MEDELDLVQFEPCPKCNFDNDRDADTCSRCGIVFSKYDPAMDRPARHDDGAFERPARAPRRRERSSAPRASFFDGLPTKRVVIGLVVAAVFAYWWFSPSYEVVGPALGEGQSAVILLHGFGASGDDLVPRAEAFSERAPDTTFVVLPAPHTKALGRAWMVGGTHERVVEQVAESKELILNTVGDVESAGVAPEDIYLGGFSQGAQMALDVAGGAPTDRRFAGLVLMSGGLPNWPDAVPPVGADNFADGARVLVTHGDSDSVIGKAQGTRAAKELRAAGVSVEMVTFSGGHTISAETEDAVVQFLNDHPQ